MVRREGVREGVRREGRGGYRKGGGGGGGGALYIKRCRRQCIEVCSADQSARSVDKFFRLHFSLLRMGSHGTFALCMFQMYEDCRSQLKFRSRMYM